MQIHIQIAKYYNVIIRRNYKYAILYNKQSISNQIYLTTSTQV